MSRCATGKTFHSTPNSIEERAKGEKLMQGQSGCAASPGPVVTTAPSLGKAAAKERGLEKRYAYPSFLSLNGEYMVFICSCIITSAAPTSTAFETFVNYVYPANTVRINEKMKAENGELMR
jgi:hypothetical protein